MGALLVALMPLALAPASATVQLQVMDADGTPTQFSAHAPQELCFWVGYNGGEPDPVVSVSFQGPAGDLGTKPSIAGSPDPVCFTAPAVADAGRWKGCQAPADRIPEAYQVMAKIDRVGMGDEERAATAEIDPDAFLWRVERIVTDKQPKPEECDETVDGDWSWTFSAGSLKCQRLPMTVTLPGFSERVKVTTDGEGLDGINMVVTGDDVRERVRLVRQADVKRSGRHVPHFEGYQDISGLVDQRGEIPGKYSLVVLSSRKIEGVLTVDNARVQGDVCSINWPFKAAR